MCPRVPLSRCAPGVGAIVCDTEDERRMLEYWVCVSPGILHPIMGPWPWVWNERLSLHWCVGSRAGVAGGVIQALSSPYGNGAPFWAPHSACPSVVSLCVRSQFDCAEWEPGSGPAGKEDGLRKG